MSRQSEIPRRLMDVRNRVAKSAERAGRDPASIHLLAVSKGQPADAIREAADSGQREFGENYLEEAEPKIRTLGPDLTWHMIGHVQSRKAKAVVAGFAMVHSVDSPALAGRLSRFAAESGKAVPIFLECNVSGEATKFGWAAGDESDWDTVLAEWRNILDLPGLRVAGLMTMAPYAADPEASRPVFRKLRMLRDRACGAFPGSGLWALSMGMSDDFEPAIEEGASYLRVGRAIFGERK
jgi:pyridoxal phosphate enzyme (YggS family)